jgi:sulfur transfer complex TusBCD TusB component (DsrH family)
LKENPVKTLQVIETAYRATLEEQDDTIVWLTHAMITAGGQFDVLLTGNAVCYAVREQRPTPLAIGEWVQTHAPDLSADLAALAGKGARLYAVEEDLEARGILATRLIEPLAAISRSELPRLFEEYPRVWHW